MDVIERWRWERMVAQERDAELVRRGEERRPIEIKEMSHEDEREWRRRQRMLYEWRRMAAHDEREQENTERGGMNLEDRDVTDEEIWRRHVRPRLELEQDILLLY